MRVIYIIINQFLLFVYSLCSQAPKLVRQLSCDTKVDPAVRERAQKVRKTAGQTRTGGCSGGSVKTTFTAELTTAVSVTNIHHNTEMHQF